MTRFTGGGGDVKKAARSRGSALAVCDPTEEKATADEGREASPANSNTRKEGLGQRWCSPDDEEGAICDSSSKNPVAGGACTEERGGRLGVVHGKKKGTSDVRCTGDPDGVHKEGSGGLLCACTGEKTIGDQRLCSTERKQAGGGVLCRGKQQIG